MRYNNDEPLVEIKKGQTGRGLLIEHDGHILGKQDTIQQIREDISNHHTFVIPDDFIVSAVFQKYGVKNANGRIYPEDILKREVQKYIDNQIRERRAIGALDHPSCQLADTKILTEKGWKNIQDVVVGENILTVTPDKKIEVKPILRKIEQPYKGKLIHLKSRFIDIEVTPNHRFPVLDRYKNWKGFYTAQQIFDKEVPDQSHCCLFHETNGYLESILSNLVSATSQTRGIGLNPQTMTIIEEDYDGMVYCVEVDNHTFYTMCKDGHCFWSGNSSVLSGHDITHNILDLRWEGRTLVGEMKLHLSPGFKRYGVCSTSGDLVATMLLDGIKVGVSSRGLGGVVEKFGTLYVDDTFELISWDVVLEPSTPNAWIATDAADLRPYIESKEPSSENPMLDDKIAQLRRILGN